MTDATISKKEIRRPMKIPAEYGGLWIALNRDRTAILDSDPDLDVLMARLGPPEDRKEPVVFYRVPRPDQVFVG